MRDSSHPVTTLPGIDAGTTLGSYELVGLLGRGAMGSVFRARHVRLGREVAIKVLNPEFVQQPDVVQRFFREAKVVNEIDHDHIVEVTDFVEAPGLAYLVMELLEGVSLRELSRARGSKYPPVKRIVAILAQVCDALEAAHDKGVVHRDLKPDNVFVVQRDGGDFAKVLDFGVAKLRDPASHAVTTSGMILGTPHYMAPEQALGREVDRQADVWAAGVVLYELLAGTVPFSAPSFVELAMQIREKPPPPLPRKTPRGERIPPWLAAVVAKCLEKRPGDRYKSMAALAQALRPPRRSGPARRVPWFPVAVAVLGATALALVVRSGLPSRAAAALASRWASLRASATAPSPQPEPAPPPHADADGAAKPKGTPPPKPAGSAGAGATRASAPARVPEPKRRTPSHATVELDVRSTPAGAAVTRLDTGKRLGKTPLRVSVPRKEATAWIELALDGYSPVKFTVDLRRDSSANVTLRGARKSKTKRR
jgi:hypothetical protein